MNEGAASIKMVSGLLSDGVIERDPAYGDANLSVLRKGVKKLKTAGMRLRESLDRDEHSEKSVQHTRRTGSSAVKKLDVVLKKNKELETLQKICDVHIGEKLQSRARKNTPHMKERAINMLH